MIIVNLGGPRRALIEFQKNAHSSCFFSSDPYISYRRMLRSLKVGLFIRVPVVIIQLLASLQGLDIIFLTVRRFQIEITRIIYRKHF